MNPGMANLKINKTFWLINQYASTPETGMGGRHYSLARELANQGHQVYLIAAGFSHILRQPPELKQEFEIKSIGHGFYFVWVNLQTYVDAYDKWRVLNWLLFTWKLLKLPKIIPAKPDAILFSSPSLIPYLAALRLSKKFKAKLVFEVRDIWPLTLTELGGYSPKHPFIRFMQWVEDMAYQKSDMVLSNLPNVVEHMVSHGMIRDKFYWIPNGFNQSDIKQAKPLSDKVKDDLPKDKFLVGYVGTLGIANALDSFIMAARLLPKHEEVVLVIVGNGKQKAALETLARDFDNVVFIEAVPKEQVQSLLYELDVCYLGLKKDPLFRFGVSPNKLFDYFLSSRPIIYAIESGDYLPVDIAKAGLSIPAENPESISNAIMQLKSISAEQRRKMGEGGRAFALANHDYSKLAGKYAMVLSK